MQDQPNEIHRLTPAGEQVEQALAQGYDAAAFNLYSANILDDVPMVEGDTGGVIVSVWPEWHQMIQVRIGQGEVLDDDDPRDPLRDLADKLTRNERGEVIAYDNDDAEADQ